MGYALMYSPCFGCGAIFGFNPHKVPSIRHEGERRPICRRCVELVNPARVKNGLEPIVVHPDAYQPINENEL